MSHFCEEGHSPIIDHSTATVVCQGCAKVLEEGLTYNEVIRNPHYLQHLTEEHRKIVLQNYSNRTKILI